ncbi:helix-turn-helix transcriptional regulator [Streptomyces albulus]|nr:helix-turn-helix transcriptional regulator [Streptomyces noursei]
MPRSTRVRSACPTGSAGAGCAACGARRSPSLAGISVDYYTRVEQGRAPAVSDSVLDAIARALRLSDGEVTYLRNVAVPRRRPAGARRAACRDRPRPCGRRSASC